MVKFGIIGYPLGHSFSAVYFNDKFQKENLPFEYKLFPISSVEELPRILQQYRDLSGINVTIPHKKNIIPYLNSLSQEASRIGAVNTVKILRNGDKIELIGYNTDYIGFKESLKPLLRNDIKKALVLGTGGASCAVIAALEDLGIKFSKVSRTKSDETLGYDDLNEEVMNDHLLIINCTPVGMWPHVEETLPLPFELISDRHICFDLIYNPEETEFLKKAKQNGAVTKNGMEMLIKQAVGAWSVWNR